MGVDQVSYVPEENLEATIGKAPTPEARIRQSRHALEVELVKIESVGGYFVSGQALFRSQRHTSSGWEDEPGANQDAALSDSQHGMFGVFDGMGGAGEAGDGVKASAAARDAFQKTVPCGLERSFMLSSEIQNRFAKSGEGVAEELKEFRRFVEETLEIAPSRFASEQDVEQALVRGFNAASNEVSRQAPRGDTTVSLIVVHETADGRLKGKIINRGDSRIYRYRKGELEQLTKDDSLVQFLADRGLIKDPDDLQEELSDEARRVANDLGISCIEGTRVKDIRHYVTSGLAGEELTANTQIAEVGLEAGDLIIEITDGAVDNLSNTQLQLVIENGKPDTDRPNTIANSIAKEARSVAQNWKNIRSKPDDIGVVVTRVQRAPTLKDVFESDYRKTSVFIKTVMKDEFLLNLTSELGVVRNQAEFALEGNPTNEKIRMLRDHVIRILQLVGDRQAELRREQLQDDSQTVKRRTPSRKRLAA